MKNCIFALYALFFNIRAMFPVSPRRVGLVSMHNANFKDGLFEVENEMKKLGEYDFLKISRTALKSPLSAVKFCTVDAFKLGGAKYIFLNDNFMPLAKLKPNSAAEIIQIWHGQGAFKKFGLHIPQPEEIRQREKAANGKLTYVVCSSEGVRGIYAEAFGVAPEQVIDTGSPNEDYYFREHNTDALRRKFDEEHPECAGKKLILYAPTFREKENGNESLLSHMDFDRLKNSFPEPSEILLRLHPQVHKNVRVSGAVDVTDYESINELCLLSDLLITDYSSVCMDFSLLNKPMIFYAYDLDEYKGDRNFYFDYESYVPGPVAKNFDELCAAVALSSEKLVSEKNDEFRRFNFDTPEGDATRRMLARIL